VSDTIVTVENLGKKYSLRHQRNERYTALRDVITEKARALFRRNGNRGQKSEVRNQQSDLRSPTSDVRNSSVEEFWALRNISFEVKKGEVVGIIGRNGAGKSTLLKILSRITDPTEGRVKIKGRVASLLEVGTGFHPELTGRENIYLNGAILGMQRREIKAKFDEIVAFAEVEKFLDTPVKRYSSGMYVRLAFAVAAHLEPEILVVDEVLAVGDAEFQKKCLGKMSEVSRTEGRTVLFVSHNMAAIAALCSRALLLQGGRMISDGAALEVTERYITSVSQAISERERETVRGAGFTMLPPKVSFENQGSDSGDLVLEFELRSEEPRDNIGFGIAIKTPDGILVSRLSPYVTNFVIKSIQGERKVRFRFPQISRYLAGGDYVIDAWLAVPRIEVLLYAEGVAHFSLIATDPYRAGTEFKHPESGFVPLPVSFEN
jgi:lipopolysaccharide transport system ATP-binding protein